MSPRALSAILATLGTPRRCEMFVQLLLKASTEPIAASLLASLCGLDDRTCRYNIDQLANVGLVTKTAHGRQAFAQINQTMLSQIISSLTPPQGDTQCSTDTLSSPTNVQLSPMTSP